MIHSTYLAIGCLISHKISFCLLKRCFYRLTRSLHTSTDRRISLCCNLLYIRPQTYSTTTGGSLQKFDFEMDEEIPLISFGVIADVQYADTEDGYNFSKTRKRYYRTALKMLDKAIQAWNDDTIKLPQFILQLGDVIDGKNKGLQISESSLDTVLDSFSKFSGNVYHIWGNHEFYNFSREDLMQSKLFSGNDKFCFPVPGKCYYSCVPHPKIRILALDTYEISSLACTENSEGYKKACEYLIHNTNKDQNSCDGLPGLMRRYVRYNGAVSDEQLNWIQENLEEARILEQNVVIIGHCGVLPEATDNSCLCWNSPDILQLIDEYADCVMCYFSGHDHYGGLACGKGNVLHIAFPGVLENNLDSDFGTVYVYKDRMWLQGNGRVLSLTLPLKFNLSKELHQVDE